MKRKILFILGVLLLIAFVTYLAYPLVLEGMANYLVVQDKLEKADVIIVLGGDNNGERVSQGIRLYKEGFAKHLLMSGGSLAWKLTCAQWMKRQAVESGVPAAVILLQDRSRSTIEDAKFSLPIIKNYGFKSAILVTSPTHSRRAAKVFRRVFPREGIKVIIYPAQKSEFNPHLWWTRHEDTAYVVWEYVSLVLYFFKGYN